MDTITVLYRPVVAIISSAMTMLVGAYYSDLSGDLLLATDGLTLVRNQTTGEWRTEATGSVKSLRLSSEVAFSLSGSFRQINYFLAHVFREPYWIELGNKSSAVDIILRDEAKYMVPEAEIDDLEERMQSFRLPFPKQNEGRSLVVMVGGVGRDGMTGLRAWRFFHGRTEINHQSVPAIYSLHDRAAEQGIIQELLFNKDTETCVARAISVAAERWPNLVGGQATFRRLSSDFDLKQLPPILPTRGDPDAEDQEPS